VFVVPKGSLWAIPVGAMHSLNNVGKEAAVMIIGFSSESPSDVDLPVAFNGLPLPLRDAYTSPHSPLKDYQGPIINPFTGFNPLTSKPDEPIPSPYSFDLKTAVPLFSNPKLGSVIWAVTENWPIIQGSGVSFLNINLKPSTARDAVWWPNSGIIYAVVRGKGYGVLVVPGFATQKLTLKANGVIFVPQGAIHSFVNTGDSDFELIGFFSNSNPLPEVSLGVATAFFPSPITNAALSSYANLLSQDKPLKGLKPFLKTPYILKVDSKLE